MSDIKIHPVDIGYVDVITQIYSDAFANYPLMVYFFGDAYQQSMKHLIKLMCDESKAEGKLLLGAFLEGRLQGCVSVKTSRSIENNNVVTEPTTSEREFADAIGGKAFNRLEAYIDLKKANKPNHPHYYINSLAVSPQSQGKGIGSALLSHIHQLSEQDSDSSGVALDTQVQKNVDYYQRFKYSVLSTANLEDVSNWFMFRLG